MDKMQAQMRIETPLIPAPIIKTTENPSDEVCILKFCELNDEAAFTCLVNRYSRSIRRIIFTVVRGPEEDLEDIEQEILLALYRNLPKFSFRSSFRTYLFRMCRNKAIDFIRKRKHRVNIEKSITKHLEALDYDTPETLYTRKLENEDMMRIIFELGEKERSLIIMKDVENLSITEIAEVFHRPAGTIKSRLHRARLKAAGKMMEEGIG